MIIKYIMHITVNEAMKKAIVFYKINSRGELSQINKISEPDLVGQ